MNTLIDNFLDCPDCSNTTLDDYFYLRDLKERRFHIISDVCAESVNDIIRQIIYINREDKGLPKENRKPVIIYISSYGGDVDAGMSLIDIIKNSITPIYTVNVGYAYSMAFFIAISGHKRFSLKNAKYLLHDGLGSAIDSTTKLRDQMEFRDRVELKIKTHVIESTKITDEQYEQKRRVEWYMFADEAKELSITDYIVGEDGCTIDDIS